MDLKDEFKVKMMFYEGLTSIESNSDISICCSKLKTDKSPSQYRGIAHALTTVLREEGMRALYKGLIPSVIGVEKRFESEYGLKEAS
ncbi:hypothetical protein L1987_46533 [Smallanthus sonchifolius]|uniref:Uncharacterized protein n=1 Tax=Smallanthus sonchifolius TaxID=185202 RepID=A0ACB9FZP3_9ASTR|nr:hypothetical protein L1987_46533 [Smallanthus sonchifolius]